LVQKLRDNAISIVRHVRSIWNGRAAADPARSMLDIDPAVRAVISEVRPFTMTSPERIAALCEATRYVEKAELPGAIVECGVWRGGSMMAVAKTLLALGRCERELFLFDTFEGMTIPGARDVSVSGEAATTLSRKHSKSEDDLFWCYAPLDAVRKAVLSTGYPGEKVHFIKGPVEQTLPAQAPSQIALLRLDTDWYESTHHELTHLYPRLVLGGPLIIDDYGHWQGARKAVDDYIAAHKLNLLLSRIDYTGRLAVKFQD
jgi:O-methyltransferase